MSENEKIDWTKEDWIKKLRQQAEDSRNYRQNLYEKVDLKNRKHILDVGCGTGAVTWDIARSTNGEVVGIDIDTEKLEHARKVLFDVPNVKLMEADVLNLPFEDEEFDLVVFNIVLVYIEDQQKAVNEMARVTQKGGFVLATLEPDYISRIDYPESPVAPMILKAMTGMGADLCAGRKLKYLFSKAGLKTEFGMGTEDEFILLKDDDRRLKSFLNDFWIAEKLLKKANWTNEQIEKYKKEQVQKIRDGLSFSFTPCFYAVGRKDGLR